MIKTTAPIRLRRYMGREDDARTFDIPAKIVGDLAVHRDTGLDNAGEPITHKGWTVSHIPTGAAVRSAHPSQCAGATLRDLIAWAKAWQAACPGYFAAVRNCTSLADVSKVPDIRNLNAMAKTAAAAAWYNPDRSN